MLTGRNTLPDFDSVSLPFKDALNELFDENSARNGQFEESFKLPLVDQAYYYELIKSVTQSKIYVSTAFRDDESEKDSSRKRAKCYRLLSQEEVVAKIWGMIVDRVDESADHVISEFIESLALESDFEAGFVHLWPKCCMGAFERQKHLVSEAFGALTGTFPFILDKIPGVQTIVDFADYRLAEAGLSVLGKKTDRMVVELFRILRVELNVLSKSDGSEDDNQARTNCLKTLLRIMSRCRLTVLKEQKLSLKKLYLSSLENMLDHVEIAVNQDYLKNVKLVMIREYKIFSCISRNLAVEVKKTIANHLIFSEKRLRDLFDLYALNLGLKEEFEFLKLAHETGARRREFYEVLASQVSSRFKFSFQKYRSADRILAFCESLYALEDPACHKFIKDGLKETFDGELKILEPLLKSLNVIIKHCYDSLRIGDHDAKLFAEGQRQKLRALFTILRDFDLSEPFFKLFLEKSFFRRVLLMGQEFLSFAAHPYNLEKTVLDEFDSVAALNGIFPQVSKLRDDLERTNSLRKGFERIRRDGVELIPMVFERKNVPSSFQQLPNHDIDLPPTLRQQWSRFHNFYLKSDSKSGLKPLTLQNSLHHLEVQTDFLLEDNSFLVLQLTLLQASVLEILNSRAEVSIALLESLLSVPAHQVDLTLQSFVDAGLLKELLGSYSVNEEFSADPKKVKNGRLKIVHRTVPKSHETRIDIAAPEPNNAEWVRDVLRASIVRSLKGCDGGMSFDELVRSVERIRSGFSLGEFKSALTESRELYTLQNNLYYYRS
ncbi:LAME_0F18976g1_1 [Lachancea meyersii CBS 8951]|uniref:LAME_0F18976g1_1 n=1 Tax=Lachancea meyersii CBS 8951 TaxID=1266667 RepID=A0A1G4K139_9SACH|nr:LAME_0F18976g1_1 [Lachancea meyersii CBS 8951]